MEKKVNLTIALPSKIFLNTKAASVIIPAVRADVDILPDRAPSVFTLDYGLLQILSEAGTVKAQYFIKSGAAQIDNNNCMVTTRDVVDFQEINPHEAKKKVEATDNEDDRLFYQMILDHQRGIRRRYLRTLNVFGAKGRPRAEVIVEIREELEKLKQRSADERENRKNS